MSVWLDDAFYEHPKFVAAGGDATLLWVCALAYARRYHTEGAVPVGIVARLTDRKSPDRLARRLVDVGLWELDGDNTNYIFHDYEDWNRSDGERSAKAQRAARIRWGSRRPPDDASSNARGNANAHANAHAQAMLGDASPSPSPSPKDPSPGLGFTHDGDGSSDDGDWDSKNGTKPKTAGQLLARLVELCTGRDRTRVNVEAVEVLTWARRHVSDQVIDEAIGYLSTAKERPVLPRSAATLIALRAADAGIVVTKFAPTVKISTSKSDVE